MEGADEVLVVPGVNGRPERSVSREILNSIVRPRMEEILALSYREVETDDPRVHVLDDRLAARSAKWVKRDEKP